MKKYQYVQSLPNGYHYLRYKRQPVVALPREIGSPEFDAAYKRLRAEAEAREKEAPRAPRTPAVKKSLAVGSLRANVDRYLASALFRGLKPNTQNDRRRILNAWCDGGKRSIGYGDLPLAAITRSAFKKMMYAREDRPGAQRSFLCAVRHLLVDCKKAQTVDEEFDPTLGLKCGRGHSPEGLKCWPEELVAQYRAYWPRGTMARLAIELLYESGAACVDVIKLGRDNIVDGLIIFDRQKTGTASFRPFTPTLERELAACQLLALSGPWLRNDHGKPFPTAAYFGERFREWAQEAGIPKGYSAHGIRKRAATDDAESGATATELMAMYGWRAIELAAHYTRKADMRRIASARAAKIRTGTT